MSIGGEHVTNRIRGADVVIETLKAAGVDVLFTLSGNQIMPLFDASLDAGVRLIHVRHEAAAVHMADAFGRLTGRAGMALVTAGPGFANCLSALYVARMAESPLVLLSGHAPTGPLAEAAFQHLPQSEMAACVCKASWTIGDPEQLHSDVLRAMSIAESGRPGPVQLSLPVNVLEARLVRGEQPVGANISDHVKCALEQHEAHEVLDAVANAQRPLVLAGPAMMRGESCTAITSLSTAMHAPLIGMESPRGVNDPSLGAVAEILPRADLVLLVGKRLDFTLRQGVELAFDSSCRFVQLDAEESAIELTRRMLGDASRLLQTHVDDVGTSLSALARAAQERTWRRRQWRDEVEAAIAFRPTAWRETQSSTPGRMHPVEVCRAVQQFLDEGDAVLISDGGEFGQWAQACLSAQERIINGPSGSIGGAIPFALAARIARPHARIVAVTGDGAFGFHALEFDTAVRHKLPFIAIVGNDAAWNAEYQIQLNKYGVDRTLGCELLPTRYDQLATSLGAHGANVRAAAELLPALQRAVDSALPTCLNVAIERTPAPIIRQGA
jgi:acetolactate synthase-1/2/3 large subunit